MAGNYGVGSSLGKLGLTGVGLQEKADAEAAFGKAADQEQQRNLENDRLERSRKQQNQSLGATGGALAGFAAGATMGEAGGPWGALIGGIIGGVAGGLF